jgi:site-specific DNA recombinase
VTRVAQPLDDYVTEAVLRRLELSDLGPLLDTGDTDVGALHTEIEAVDAKLAELAAAWSADALTRLEWDAARAGLIARRDQAQRRLDVARRDSAAARITGIDARVLWEKLDLDGKRAIIRELLPGGVVVHPIGKGRWRTFDPSTVTLGWFDA